MKPFSFLILLLFFFIRPTFSQNTPTFWLNYTDGKCVNDMVMDGDSLWIATNGGLTVIDTSGGNSFYYNHANSGLASNAVQKVLIDQNHNKWILSSLGVQELTANGWVNFTLPGQSQYIHTLEIDRNNNVWFIGEDQNTGSPSLFTINSGVVTAVDSMNSGLPRNNIRALTTDRQHNLWIITGECLVKYDGTVWNVVDSSNTSLSSMFINTFTVDKLERVWLGSYFDISFFNGTIWDTISSANSPIQNVGLDAVAADTNGGVFICNGNRLLQTDGVNWIVHDSLDYPPAPFRFFSLSVDGQNNLFVGTADNGLYINQAGQWKWFSSTASGLANNHLDQVLMYGRKTGMILSMVGPSLFNNSVWTSYQPFPSTLQGSYGRLALDSNNNIWGGLEYGYSGTPGPIAAIFDGSSWSLVSSVNAECYDITIDDSNHVWFATHNGLYKYDGTTWTNYTTSNSPLADQYVTRVYADRNNNIWISTPYGAIQKFDGVNWQTINTSGFPGGPLQGITEDYQGNIWMSEGWLGSGVTITIGHYDGSSWAFINNPPGDWPTCLAVDHDNNLWAGFLGQGLGKYDGSHWTVYTPSNSGLPESNISDIAIDDYNNIWIATQASGLAIFNENGITYDVPAPARTAAIGSVFMDVDSDGIQSTGEPFLNAQKFFETPDSTVSSSNSQGVFTMHLYPGDYTVSPLPPVGWRVTTDSLMYHFTIDSNRVVNHLDFGFSASPYHGYGLDLNSSPVRCGFTVSHWIHYVNRGSLMGAGRIELRLDTAAIFVSSYPAPNSVNGRDYKWNFLNLAPFYDHYIYVNLEVPNSPGDSLHERATLVYYDNSLPIQGASAVLDNEIICAADPNDKLVLPEGTGAFHDTYYRDTLTYIIRFQNVGTDTAFFIKIIDTLDASLDPASFEFISGSEAVNISFRSNTLIFDIPDCSLPPASLNEAASEGYVRFRIAPHQSVVPNTRVVNSADIYFNFNRSVRTNEVFNTLVDSLSLATSPLETAADNARIFPNPMHNYATVIYPNIHQKKFDVDLYSVAGVKLDSWNDATGSFSLMYKNLSPGFYWIIISNEDQRFQVKIIVD